MKSYRLFLVAGLVAGTVAAGSFAVLAGEQRSADVAAQRPPDSARIEAYCGVICLARAARAMGNEVEFAELLKPQYIGSARGSSIGELARAAADLGLHAEPMSRMTCGMLRQAPCPVILHVKPALGAREYTHWVLFMGAEEGKARIYDGTKPVRLVEFEELAASWDGVGLLVSRSPIKRSGMVLEACLGFAVYSSMGLLAVVLIHKCEHRRAERFRRWSWQIAWRSSVAQAAGLAVITLLVGAGYSMSHREGFLTCREAIEGIQDAKLGTFLPKVKAKEITRLRGRGHVVVVDARNVEDFEAGHIEGSIGIPAHWNVDRCRGALSGVSKGDQIIIYCQSSGCPFGEILARKLLACGFENLTLFPGGWLEWEQREPNSHK